LEVSGQLHAPAAVPPGNIIKRLIIFKYLIGLHQTQYEYVKCKIEYTTTINNFVNCGFVAPYYKILTYTYTYPHAPSK
jgi:hypothetical protein